MADTPIPSHNFDDATNAAIIASGRNPSSLSAVFESAIHKGLSVAEAGELETISVFGAGYKRDPKTNRPIETGRGSRLQQTTQHLAALQKLEGRV
jgi:hypothetical protein